jgi:hypothetical protein
MAKELTIIGIDVLDWTLDTMISGFTAQQKQGNCYA